VWVGLSPAYNEDQHCCQVTPDSHSELEPPLPIPNRTVKRLCADDSDHSIVKVGHRQAPQKKTPSQRWLGVFSWLEFLHELCGAHMSNTDLLGQLLLSLEQHDADLFKRLYPALSKQTVQSHPIQAIELAYALLGKKRFEEAAGIAYALLEKNGKSAPLLSFLARVHLRAGDFRAASELYSKAAVIGLDAIGQAEYAFSEAKLRRTECAISLYKKALKQGHPDPDFVKAKLHHQLQLGCMWGELEEIEPELRASLRIGASAVDPFAFQASTSRPEELLLAARNFATRNGIKRVIGDVQKREKRWSSSRALRLGFFSGEFRSQATGFLVVGLMEQFEPPRVSRRPVGFNHATAEHSC
jgi:tetratricopeptide (TPR) repeat protein